MNKQELLHEINKAKEHIANMEKALEKYKYERWKPKRNETYYFVNSWCEVEQDWASTNFTPDVKRYYAYNCFETKEQAKQEAEKILVRRMLEDVARRLNNGRKIVFDSRETKYFLTIDDANNIGFEAFDLNYRYKIQGIIYCLDINFKDVAIREIGEERLKKYLRGE